MTKCRQKCSYIYSAKLVYEDHQRLVVKVCLVCNYHLNFFFSIILHILRKLHYTVFIMPSLHMWGGIMFSGCLSMHLSVCPQFL